MALKLILPSFLLKKEDRENRTALPASWRSGESRERERERERERQRGLAEVLLRNKWQTRPSLQQAIRQKRGNIYSIFGEYQH